MRGRIGIRVVLVAALAAAALPAVSASAANPADARPEADWILGLQISSGPDAGLIPLNLPAELCVPYFSNAAASGLAAMTYSTGDKRYSDAAWRWLEWYGAHMDAAGFITDYELRDPNPNDQVVERRWLSTGDYDSTDAYAATFILAVKDTFVASGDKAKLAALWPAVRKAVSAIEATAAPDWLTYAKPGLRQKYLMDNVEVYEGWRALSFLASEGIDDAPLRTVATRWLAEMPAALAKFWNASAAGYDVAISDIGVHDLVDWTELYPSATAQAWMVNTGLVPADRTQALLAKIEQTHPSWDKPFATDLFDRPSGRGWEAVKWWPEVIDAFARSGLHQRADVALGSMVSAAGSTRRWPYHAGNAGRIIALLIAAPTTTLVGTPPPATTTNAASFAFTGSSGPSEGALTFECRLDGSAYAACSSPRSTSGLAEGMHTFEVRARDGIGRIDETPASWSWAIDMTSPVLSLTDVPANPSNAWPSTFHFAASDNLSTPVTECALDGGSFTACSSPYAYAGLPTASHTFRVRSRDPAGNASPVRTYAWFVDGVAPVTRITAGPPPVVEGGSVTISFDAIDDVTSPLTFECRIDYQPFARCTSPMSYDSSKQGARRFEVRATDAAGNVDATSEVRKWVVDHSPPATWLIAGPPPYTTARGASFQFVGLDDVGVFGYECSVDGSAYGSCTSPMIREGFADGRHTFGVRALDGAGIADPTPSLHEWIVDTGKPETTVATAENAILTDAMENRFVSGSVSDAWSGVGEVRVTFAPPAAAGGGLTVKAIVSCSDATARSCTWIAPAPGNPGRYTVTAWSIDRAGNIERAGPGVTVFVL